MADKAAAVLKKRMNFFAEGILGLMETKVMKTPEKPAGRFLILREKSRFWGRIVRGWGRKSLYALREERALVGCGRAIAIAAAVRERRSARKIGLAWGCISDV